LEKEEITTEFITQRVWVRAVELDPKSKGIGRSNFDLLPDLFGVVEPVRLRVGVGVLQTEVVRFDVETDVITDTTKQFIADTFLAHIERQIGAIQQENFAVDRILLLQLVTFLAKWPGTITTPKAFREKAEHC